MCACVTETKICSRLFKHRLVAPLLADKFPLCLIHLPFLWSKKSWSKEELQRRTEKVCPSQPVRWGPPLFEAGFWARGDQHNGHCAHCWSVLRLQLNNHTVCFSSIRRYYKMMEDAAVLKNDGTEPAPLQLITRLWNNVIILKSETFSYWKQKENWLVT